MAHLPIRQIKATLAEAILSTNTSGSRMSQSYMTVNTKEALASRSMATLSHVDNTNLYYYGKSSSDNTESKVWAVKDYSYIYNTYYELTGKWINGNKTFNTQDNTFIVHKIGSMGVIPDEVDTKLKTLCQNTLAYNNKSYDDGITYDKD
jgi:hypothetical protein